MRIALAGAGKLGVKILEMLLGGDHAVTVIDRDDEVLAGLDATYDIRSVLGNAKEVSLLRELGIDTFDCLIAVTDRDEKNIVIAAFAKKLGCAKTIARIRDPEHLHQLDFIKETMNIDYLINPDYAITQEIFKYLVEKYAIRDGIFSTGKISLIEFVADKLPLIPGLPIRDIPTLLGHILVVAVSRNGKVIIPHGDLTVLPEDTLYLIGEKKLIGGLSKKVYEKGRYTNVHRVMIAGGGKVGFYLAHLLSEFGASVKIIEIDRARCQVLSARLENVLVLHGDATDPELLSEENFDEMDAFVSVTGYDEENLLLALMAKQRGIEDVIAKISRESYSGLIESMGVDMALNPLEISASSILRFLQNAQVVSSQIIQGQAEFIEIIANEAMVMADTPISELGLPNGVMIAAVSRNAEVIIPDGATRIEKGDRVLIFCLLSEVTDLERLLRIRKGLFK